MPGLSYKKAMASGLITQKEIDRFAVAAMCSIDTFKARFSSILILYSRTNNDQPDFHACALEASTTQGSFSVMFNATVRKLKAAKCFIGEDGDCETSAPTTPAPKKAGRKRKTPGTDDTPSTSGRKRSAKVSKIVDHGEDEDEDILGDGIKPEQVEENH